MSEQNQQIALITGANRGIVSDEDFAREPHRNKLNVLISQTNHLSYHPGQLSLPAKK